MKRILIADCYCSVNCDGTPSGHFLNYFKDMYGVLNEYFNVTLACSKEYQKQLKGKFIDLPSNPAGKAKNKIEAFRLKFREFRSIRRVLKSDYDKIIFQAGNFTFQCLAILTIKKKYISNKQIYLTVYSDLISGTNKKDHLRKILFKKAKGRISGIISSTPSLGKVYETNRLIIPDYFNRPVLDFMNYNKESYNYDIAVLGIIYDHKDVESVVNAFIGTKYKILIAGRFNSKRRYEYLIKQVSGENNITIINKYLPENEYTSLLSQSKYIMLPYTLNIERSSGVFYEAMYNFKPLLVSNAPFFRVVRDKNIGYQYVDSPQEIIKYLEDNNNYKKMQENILSFIKKNEAGTKEKILMFFNQKACGGSSSGIGREGLK